MQILINVSRFDIFKIYKKVLGSKLGSRDGSKVGLRLGSSDGLMVGSKLGSIDGSIPKSKQNNS